MCAKSKTNTLLDKSPEAFPEAPGKEYGNRGFGVLPGPQVPFNRALMVPSSGYLGYV